jgi:hypothetical protein
MHIPVYTRQFERDIKRVRKRGKNLEKFKIITRSLIEGNRLIHWFGRVSNLHLSLPGQPLDYNFEPKSSRLFLQQAAKFLPHNPLRKARIIFDEFCRSHLPTQKTCLDEKGTKSRS